MGNYTRPLDLYKAQVKRFEALALDRKRGHRELANRGFEDAGELTSGILSPKETRGAFARGASRASRSDFGLKRLGIPNLPINKQSGTLHGGFKLIDSGRGAQSFDLFNTAPYQQYILSPSGTKFMVARGYFEEIRKRWTARNKAFIDVYSKQQRKP